MEHITKRSRPDLDWKETPRGFYIARELLMSDAYRALSKLETDLLLFIYSRREYPSKRARKKKGVVMDYWNPLNGYGLTVPMIAVKDFFDKPGRMKTPAPAESTMTRSIKKLMHVGFISLVELGGSGMGHMSKYRLEHNWRVWKK